ALELSFVVAQNDRRRRLGDDLAQSLQVPVDVLGRREWKPLLRFGVRHRDTREAGQPCPPCSWIDQQLFARPRLFSQAAGHPELMRGTGPRSLDFALDGRSLTRDDDRVAGEAAGQVRS